MNEAVTLATLGQIGAFTAAILFLWYRWWRYDGWQWRAQRQRACASFGVVNHV